MRRPPHEQVPWAKCPHCGVWVHPRLTGVHHCTVTHGLWLHPSMALFFGGEAGTL